MEKKKNVSREARARQGETHQEGRGKDAHADDHGRGVGVASAEGESSGDNAIGDGGGYCTRGDRSFRSVERRRTTIAGGMLRQLIDEYREQRSVKLAEIERLDSRIEHFEALLSELEQRVEENP